jgi:hypothetical protein
MCFVDIYLESWQTAKNRPRFLVLPRRACMAHVDMLLCSYGFGAGRATYFQSLGALHGNRTSESVDRAHIGRD